MARSKLDMSDLAARMLGLEDAAFREFGRTFGPRFRAYFRKQGLSQADSEDLAVSCVTDIALKVGKYRPIEAVAFEAWVFTLARNYLNDWWRSHRATEPLPESVESVDVVEEEQGLDSEGTLAVREAMTQISDADQVVIQLRHFGGEHSYAEIADRLGISAVAARVRHSRALERLETILGKDPRVIKILGRKVQSEPEESICTKK